MKILHINWSGELGGAENIAYLIAKEQVKAGNKITIAYMARKSVYGSLADKSGIKTIEFNMRNGLDILRFKKYINFIKKQKFDIIHDHNGTPLVRLSKLSCKSIFIQHIHGTKWGNIAWEKKPVLFWKILTRSLVNHWLANSQHTKKIAIKKEKIPLAKISIVYNGIDIENFKPLRSKAEVKKELKLSETDFVIGSIGCLDKAKGTEKIFPIAKKIDGKFVIVGDGELRKKLEKTKNDFGLKDKVIFTGARTDIPDLLSAFDVFLSTSQWEAFGVAIVEAMAIGVPVIAFAVGGVKEIIKQDCGILIPQNDIEKMKEAIIYLKTNKNITEKLRKLGHKAVKENFDITKKTEEIQIIYKLYKHKNKQENSALYF